MRRRAGERRRCHPGKRKAPTGRREGMLADPPAHLAPFGLRETAVTASASYNKSGVRLKHLTTSGRAGQRRRMIPKSGDFSDKIMRKINAHPLSSAVREKCAKSPRIRRRAQSAMDVQKRTHPAPANFLARCNCYRRASPESPAVVIGAEGDRPCPQCPESAPSSNCSSRRASTWCSAIRAPPELPLMDAFAVEQRHRYVLGLQEAALDGDGGRLCPGLRQARGAQPPCRAGPRQRHGHALRRPEGGQRRSSSPPASRTPNTSPPSRSCRPTCRTLARPFVKWAAEVQRLADLPRLVHRAAKTALAPPTGPVFLSLPGDILKAEGEIDLMAPTRVAAEGCAAMRRRLPRPRRASRQGRAAGDHGRRRGGAEPRPCRTGGARRTHRRPGLCGVRAEHRLVPDLAPAVSRRHDHAPAAGGAQGARRARSAVLGRRRPASRCRCLPTIEPMPPGMPLIHLDIDPWEIGKNYPTPGGDSRRPEEHAAGTHRDGRASA